MTMRTEQLGRIGERLAERCLRAAGLIILDRRWQATGGHLRGELDLVCRDGAEVVVCEVKTRRRAEPWEAAAAVDAAKLRQLRRLGLQWLAERDWVAKPLRIDVVAVAWPREGGRAVLEHLRGVG